MAIKFSELLYTCYYFIVNANEIVDNLRSPDMLITIKKKSL